MLAYSNPWASPLGWQLCPTRRENVCAALNSAILGMSKYPNNIQAQMQEHYSNITFYLSITESMNYSWRPPLEICVAHACELLHLMANSAIGSCAFASIEDILDSTQ